MPSAIMGSMRSRASQIIVALLLFTCFSCPLIEMFDYWDHPIQTGNDTGYDLVVLVLCVGIGYSLARCIFKSPLIRSVAEDSDLWARKPAPCFSRNSFALILLSTSPPAVALRI
jgi:hypothetical protein